MAADFITFMEPLDGRPTAKRVHQVSGRLTTSPADPTCTWFRAVSCPVQDLASLARLLDRAAQTQTVFAVRGRIKAGADPDRMRRTHVNDPTLELASRHWLALDLDKFMPDVQDFASRVEHYAKLARAALPRCFHEAGAWYQATGSAGIKPGVRLRLVFWLAQAMSDSELKAWAQGWACPVDRSLFTPSQPHYLAGPILDDVPDPVQGPRTGMLSGGEVQYRPESDLDRVLTAQAELEQACRKIKRTPEGERRNTLNRLAFQLTRKYGPELDPNETQTALEQAATEGGFGDPKAFATIREAIRDGLANYQHKRAGWRTYLVTDKDGVKYLPTAANVSLILEHHEEWAGKLGFDERAHSPIWLKSPKWGGDIPRPVVETDTARLVEYFQHGWKMSVQPAWVRDGINKASETNTYDPIQDWLSALPKWDGRDRVDTFFVRHLGVADTGLVRAQTRCWFLQAVRRAYASLSSPVQADYMVVLSGPQGIGKSRTLRALCPLPRFFRDHLPDLSSKDARQAVLDAWIIELSELTQRKADRDTFKAFLTAQVDKFRKPYGRDETTAARRCVLIGSTNESEFLQDPTGNRRFWPFTCSGRADLDLVLAERDQLWAEAVARAEAGERSWLPDDLEAEARVEQDRFREELPVLEQIRAALLAPAGGFASSVSWESWQLGPQKQILYPTLSGVCQAVGWSTSHLGQVGQARTALRDLGWHPAQKLLGGSIRRVWVAPEGWAYQVERAHVSN